jgi:phage shock protein A
LESDSYPEMWNRTKRLINSYLDELIQKVSSPDRDVRGITRSEIARLNELEVQTRASAKVLEKELAEVELKILGLAERERIAREQGNDQAASAAGSQLLALGAQRDLIKQQISEANSAADRARSLREERRRQGEDLATETHLAAMRENLSAAHKPFDSTDPSATIDEMRQRIARTSGSLTSNRVAEADRELEAERTRARVEDVLTQYKQGLAGEAQRPTADQTVTTPDNTNPQPTKDPESSNDSPAQEKSLGRTEGPVRPID